MFLEILTRCYRRPRMLATNQASLRAQTCDDWTQTLLVDEVGRGVGWSYENMAAYADQLVGDYVWILDDDDECISPTLVEDLKRIAEADDPDVIMIRMDHGAERLGVHPDDAGWRRRPQQGNIGVSAFVVRRQVWQQFAHMMCPGGYASDFTFIKAIYNSKPKIFWHDCVASRVQRVSVGRPEGKTASILVFTPTWRVGKKELALRPETKASIEAQHFDSLHWEIGLDNPFGAGDGRNVGHQYRNAWRMAIDGGYDGLLTVEHDMRLPDPEAVQRLWDTQAEIVYGVYLLRHGSPVLNVWEYIGGQNLGQSLTLYPRKVRRLRSRNVMQVCGIGWGCTLIRRSVFVRIPISDRDHQNPAGDLAFAEDCQRAGVVSVARADVACGHWNGETWLEPWQQEQPEIVKVLARQRLVAPGVVKMTPDNFYEIPREIAMDLARAGYVEVQ